MAKNTTEIANKIPKSNNSYLIEMKSESGSSAVSVLGHMHRLNLKGVELDDDYEPINFCNDPNNRSSDNSTHVLRCTINDHDHLKKLNDNPAVLGVWQDTVIAPFEEHDIDINQPNPALRSAEPTVCPIPPCDCDPTTARGNLSDVATYLKVNQIWAQGYRGNGLVIGVVDGGITAQGRAAKPGQTRRRVPRVIGGWPVNDWGTEAAWGEHGNMTSTDVLGMAPEAQIYDMRIAASGQFNATVSRALQAYNWAITQFRTNGTPQVLSNSWGIYQEDWDRSYARNPNHPFTRKVVEAINEGIIVLFSAGNCGEACGDQRCGRDVGPSRSIWGANGHPLVMTVSAVNINEEYIAYSSQGPAALDPNKPDFCSISHFAGYNPVDGGTSASAPILAGVVALLKQAVPNATQNAIKAVLRNTAKNIGTLGFDQNSGAGIVRPLSALIQLQNMFLSRRPSRRLPRSQAPIDHHAFDPRRRYRQPRRRFIGSRDLRATANQNVPADASVISDDFLPPPLIDSENTFIDNNGFNPPENGNTQLPRSRFNKQDLRAQFDIGDDEWDYYWD